MKFQHVVVDLKRYYAYEHEKKFIYISRQETQKRAEGEKM